jgi:hypothetical protein
LGAVGSLNGQFAHTNQDVRGFLQRAFSGLRERDAVIRVADGLRKATDLRVHTSGNGEAGGIVLRAVDTLATGQAIHCLTLHHACDARAVLGTQRTYVG